MAIGNGLTDPRAQTLTLASSAYFAGLVPPGLRDEIASRAAHVRRRWIMDHALSFVRLCLRNRGLPWLMNTKGTEPQTAAPRT